MKTDRSRTVGRRNRRPVTRSGEQIQPESAEQLTAVPGEKLAHFNWAHAAAAVQGVEHGAGLRGHYDDIPSWGRIRVPERMRHAVRADHRRPGRDIALVVSDADSQPTGQNIPSLIIIVVQMKRRLVLRLLALRSPRSIPLRQHELRTGRGQRPAAQGRAKNITHAYSAPFATAPAPGRAAVPASQACRYIQASITNRRCVKSGRVHLAAEHLHAFDRIRRCPKA
jgi:hypothetical protein